MGWRIRSLSILWEEHSGQRTWRPEIPWMTEKMLEGGASLSMLVIRIVVVVQLPTHV